jgi:hypothetical protein
MPLLILVYSDAHYGTLARQLMFRSASFNSRYMGKINPELFTALQGMELPAEVVEQLKKNARKTQVEEDFKRTLEKLWLSKSNESRTDIRLAPNGARGMVVPPSSSSPLNG